MSYDKERNEYHIHGCNTCPFLEKMEGWVFQNYFCPLIKMHIDRDDNEEVIPEYFPDECPLRDPNFKLVRHFDKE